MSSAITSRVRYSGIGLSAALLALVAATATLPAAAGAQPDRHGRHLCYSNIKAGTGNSVNSQLYESAHATLDDEAAQDFTLTKPCTVYVLYVAGFYTEGSGPASSEDVRFYNDAGGTPGTVVTNGYQASLQGNDTNGHFSIHLRIPLTFQPGTYWVSMQARLNFAFGKWGWLEGGPQDTYVAVWRNPGDGFGSHCTDWTSILTCSTLLADDPSLMFTLKTRQS